MSVQAKVSTTQRTTVLSLTQGANLIHDFSTRLLRENAPTKRIGLPPSVLKGGKTAIENYIQQHYRISSLQDRQIKAERFIDGTYGLKLLHEFATQNPQTVLENWTPVILGDLKRKRLLRPAPLALIEVKGLNGINLNFTDLTLFKLKDVIAPNATCYGTVAWAGTTIDGGIFDGLEASHARFPGIKFINDVSVRVSYFQDVLMSREGMNGGTFTGIGVKDGGIWFAEPQQETIRK